MRKNSTLLLLLMAALMPWPAQAQFTDVIKGVFHNMRTNNNDDPWETVGSVYEKDGVYAIDKYGQDGWTYTNLYLTISKGGILSMGWDGSVLTNAVQNPRFTRAMIVNADNTVNWELAQTANNLVHMYGNSGSVYVNGKIVTVYSRDESSTVDDELFIVRKWDAKTGKMLSSEVRPKSDRLESAGMAYNPKDGKVYGLFYLTGNDLPSEITDDPEYFTDQDDDLTDGDAGYALCTIDLQTMKVTPITPGLYYYNFITFAINSEGRAFALTSGGTRGVEGEDGKTYDIDGNLTGAQLYEFDLTTGLAKTKAVQATDTETGETYTENVPLLSATGYCSKYKRQAACFAKSNPNTMYWVGYYNSGKGINDYGSWGELPDSDWKNNHKYDTCLYEVDITTGKAERKWNITDRYMFSALWVDGDDSSDDSGVDVTGIQELRGNAAAKVADGAIYNLQGQRVQTATKGLFIIGGKKVVVK